MKKKPYIITLKLGDVTHKGEGDTLLEALMAIHKPVKIITKGVLTTTDGTKTLVQPLTPIRIKRLFYPQAQFYQARYLSLLLK